MKTNVSAVFVPLLLVAGLLVLSGCSGGEARLQEAAATDEPDLAETFQLQNATAFVDPDLLDALQREEQVEVLVSLKPPDMPLSEQTTAIRRDNAAERQDRVLSVLTPSDFTLTHRYEVASALAGSITASGVEKLAAHPDVAAIGMSRKASWF